MAEGGTPCETSHVIRATIVRQTMFAEFEKTTHAMVEAGEPLTLAAFQQVYRKLLEDYFGPEFSLDEALEPFDPQRVAGFLVGGIAAGKRLHETGLVDFAPTLAKLLGLPSPKDATGRVLEEALSEPH